MQDSCYRTQHCHMLIRVLRKWWVTLMRASLAMEKLTFLKHSLTAEQCNSLQKKYTNQL